MHGIKALLFLAVAALVVAAGVFWFFPDLRPEFLKKKVREFEGFTAAKTPTEALDKFREAIRKRDYETAATYCTGDYKEQMIKGAKSATKLGKAIDDLRHNMETNGASSDKVKVVLALLEPFPRDFKTLKVKENGDKAVAVLVGEADSRPFERASFSETWKLDPSMFNTLVPATPGGAVELRREGGDEKSWKIAFPVDARLRTSVDRLKDKATEYSKALEKVKLEIKNNPATRADVERRLKTELEEVAK